MSTPSVLIRIVDSARSVFWLVFHHDVVCPPLSAQVQSKIDALTDLDQVLYTAAQVEYDKVTRRANVPIDFTWRYC